jgi:ActR/RegA family two-component response regulator
MVAPADIILIVDDEQSVRQTFQEWLEGADLGCQILTATDAEGALVEANRQPIDLAILDWNLGAGNDGLHLLEDLAVFNPEVVAILVTGYADQATPLDAMRMGVRDYLDKNQDLDRDSFLKAVRRQLDQIRPAKRERRLHQSLVAFREAVEKVLPLVQAAAAFQDPVPFPEAVRSLLRFLMRSTGAQDAALIARSYDPQRQPAENYRAYDAQGKPLTVTLVPWARSVAASLLSLQQPSAMNRLEQAAAEGLVQLQPFEVGHGSVLAAPLPVAPGVHVVLELFDKQGPGGTAFTVEDHQLLGAAAEFGTEMLRQALAERQTHQVLLDAVAAALGAGDSLVASLRGSAAQRQEEPPPAAVLDRLREGLRGHPGQPGLADETLRLVEAIRVLSLRHGPPAVEHCTRLVESLRGLLDQVSGQEPSPTTGTGTVPFSGSVP